MDTEMNIDPMHLIGGSLEVSSIPRPILDDDDRDELQRLEELVEHPGRGTLQALLEKRSDLNLQGKVYRVSAVEQNHGGYSDIFTGYYVSANGKELKVAVKKLRVNVMVEKKFQKKLAKELYIWSRLNHPRILSLEGFFVGDNGKPHLVSRWMENGTILSYLGANPRADMLSLVIGIAEGIRYLHTSKIVHSDVKPENVLVSDFGEPLLCDFGVSRILEASNTFNFSTSVSGGLRGTIRYISREILQATDEKPEFYCEESDVWAFGMTVAQLLTRKAPYNHIKLDVQVILAIINGQLPSCPQDVKCWPLANQIIWRMCEFCWEDQSTRPSIHSIISELQRLSFILACRLPDPDASRYEFLYLHRNAVDGLASDVARNSSSVSDKSGQSMPEDGHVTNDYRRMHKAYLDQYVHTPNRVAFGERTVIVMSPRVAQKSYGAEKRFLCPPPMAIVIGNSWWSETTRRGEEPKRILPRIVVSVSGEPGSQEASVEWTSTFGKAFDDNGPPAGTTFIGSCVGRQLYISVVHERKKKVEARVKIMEPALDNEPERVIGVFPSQPIKVISKPSRKRRSVRNLDMCINHGSTVSMFHRLRSQTVSTKYLCVSNSGDSFKGSDGSPLTGIDQRTRTATPSFVTRTSRWDPFIVYIVDVNKPSGGIDRSPPPPPQPGYPSPPPNALPFTNNGSQIPIFYNQTVVLQCLTSGVVSPVLIIRKVDRRTTVVGGGLAEGAKGVADHYCVPGEVCGDLVMQLHKIAFEVFDPNKGVPEPGSPGLTSPFLSCMGEKVNTYRPFEGRSWNTFSKSFYQGSNSSVHSISSIPSSPASLNSSVESFFDGGPLSRMSTSDCSTSSESRQNQGRIGKHSAKRQRRRRSPFPSRMGSREALGSEQTASSGELWNVDVGETGVWTIAETHQVRYNFCVPPVLFDQHLSSGAGISPMLSRPITRFPTVTKYLPPDRTAQEPGGFSRQNENMLTLYGENFDRIDPITVYFDSDPSSYVEIRSSEVIVCMPPEQATDKRREIILMRSDGIIFPTSVMYP